MKLRPRTKVATNNRSVAAAPVPVVPPDTTRLHTPPISLSDTSSSSVEDDSDMEDRMESVSPPTKDSPGPKTTVRAAPLTVNNLQLLQEEITSSEGVRSEGDKSSPPTPSTRLVQARDFLLAENLETCPELTTRIQQIADYLRDIPRETREKHSSVYSEVRNLMRSHRAQIAEREESHRHRVPSEPPLPLLPTAGEDDDKDGDERTDPFEWTNKLDDLIDNVRSDPDKLTREYMIARVRELARPLNGGFLPDGELAGRLINEQVFREHARTEEKKEKRSWAVFPPERELPWEKKTGRKERRGDDGLDRGGGEKRRKEGAEKKEQKRVELGRGSYMPREVRDFDWQRDGGLLLWRDDGKNEDVNRRDAGSEDGEGAQILLAETPFLQFVMGGQVRRDLLEKGMLVIHSSCFECAVSGSSSSSFVSFFFLWGQCR